MSIIFVGDVVSCSPNDSADILTVVPASLGGGFGEPILLALTSAWRGPLSVVSGGRLEGVGSSNISTMPVEVQHGYDLAA